jgi:hypothetical protein
MTNRFLAEDFRKLIDVLEDITTEQGPNSDVNDLMHKSNDAEDQEDNFEKHADVEDFMQVDRPDDISKDSIENFDGLIEYLDQFSELDQWRNDNAQYDDAFYDDLPLDKLESIANMNQDEIENISSKFKDFAGDVLVKDGKVNIYGEP